MPSNFTKNKYTRAAIVALFVLPVAGVLILARAKWVHKPLPFLGEKVALAKGDTQYHTVNRSLHLVSQNAEKFTLDKFKDKILLVNIFFASCPEVCPEMNNQVQSVAKKYFNEPNIQFLSITIDPNNDSVPVIKNYANAKYSVDKLKLNWTFATGSKSEIYDWVLNDLLLKNKQEDTTFIHDDNLVLIDKEMHIRGIFPTRKEGISKRAKYEYLKSIFDAIEDLKVEYRAKKMDK